jgi:sarcosine oxidase gamma subunit
MGSLSRKIKRKNILKKRKHNKRNLKKALNAVAGMPTECTKCSEKFNDESNPDQWMVIARDEMVSLYCPACNDLDDSESANSPDT